MKGIIYEHDGENIEIIDNKELYHMPQDLAKASDNVLFIRIHESFGYNFSEFYNEIFVSDAIEKDQSYVDFNCVCLEPNSFIVFLFPNQHMEVNNQIKCFILDENKRFSAKELL